MEIYSKEDMEKLKANPYTIKVKDLLKYIERFNVSEDAIILCERVEDVYFKNMKVIPVDSYTGVLMEEHNKKVISGYYDDPENRSVNMTMAERNRIYSEEEMLNVCEQTYPIQSFSNGEHEGIEVLFVWSLL